MKLNGNEGILVFVDKVDATNALKVLETEDIGGGKVLTVEEIALAIRQMEDK